MIPLYVCIYRENLKNSMRDKISFVIFQMTWTTLIITGFRIYLSIDMFCSVKRQQKKKN